MVAMASVVSIVFAVAGLASAPAAQDPVHLGLGFEAAQLSTTVAAAPDASTEPKGARSEPAPQPVLPRAGMRPPSTLDSIRHTRRARAFSVGAAVAVQGAMIVYGILSLLEQEREAEALRSAGGPTFNPYPR